MKKFLIKKKKYLCLIIVAIVAFNFLFLPLTTLAQSIPPPPPTALDLLGGVFGEAVSWVSGEVLLFISSGISAILGVFFGLILWLEAIIIDYIISPNNFPLTTAPIVTLGWGITRDIANMFFIFITQPAPKGLLAVLLNLALPA